MTRAWTVLLVVLLAATLGALVVLALVESTDDPDSERTVSPLDAHSQEPPSGVLRKCGHAVVADWFDNGRIDLLYDSGCYGAALNLLPADGETQLAVAEIQRAYLAAGSKPKTSDLPPSLELLCLPGAASPPCGPGARIGRDYAHLLYTHCGVESTIFDGRLWLAQPPLNNGFRGRPSGWGDPTAKGTIRLLGEDEAKFKTGSLVAPFMPAPPGYQREACD